MKQSWSDYEKTAKKGPMSLIVKIIIAFFIISIPLSILRFGCGFFKEAAQVAQEEFGPRALLEKYEWFKDASAQLDKKIADISVYEQRLTSMNETYNNVSRLEWPREDREQYNIWASEVAGVRASYNSLAAEYNSAMAQVHKAFINIGKMPEGGFENLPREYREYIGI